ncbi:MAG: hypothetical protein KBC91_07120, partial [Candidatus Omnitrophica bacterium]|nr:hypothetical protein [Candidatus Omnitrophota bacterium]
MNHTIKKIIAVMTLVAFLAQPGYGMTVARGVSSNFESSAVADFRIELPSELGQVEKLHAGAGPVLVQIQEAHGDPAIQKKIEQILTHLKTKYGFKQVFVEGSAFPCERRLLDFFPDHPKVTRKAAQRLMKQGLVSGPENFLLKNPDTSLSGVEDLQAYNKNSRSFYQVLKQKEKAAGFLQSMDAQMDRLAGAYLNRDLRDFLKQVKAFDEDKLSLQALLVFIAPQMKKLLKADLEKPASQIEWPMLVRLAALERWQKEFDASKFEQEKKAFVGAAGRFLPKKLEVGRGKVEAKNGQVGLPSTLDLRPSTSILTRLEAFLSATNATQSTSITDIEPLIEELVSKLPSNFDYERYPQVIRRIGMAIIQNEMNGEMLMGELDGAIGQLEDHLAASDREKDTVALLRDYRIAVKLLKLEWTRREYDDTSDNRQATSDKAKVERLRPSFLVARAIALNEEGRVKDVKFEHVEDLEELYREALEFYKGAEAREAGMMASIAKQMQASGDRKAVLITGGFHASAIAQIVSEKNWNYALITPFILEVKGRDGYVESLLQNYYSGAAARAGLKDIPYATTRLPEIVAMRRTPAFYFARMAAALANLGAPTEAINRTAVMRQLASGVGVMPTAAGLKIQLDPGAQGPGYVVDANGHVNATSDLSVLNRWLDKVGGVSFRSEVRQTISQLGTVQLYGDHTQGLVSSLSPDDQKKMEVFLKQRFRSTLTGFYVDPAVDAEMFKGWFASLQNNRFSSEAFFAPVTMSLNGQTLDLFPWNDRAYGREEQVLPKPAYV